MSGVPGKCSPTRWLWLLGLHPSGAGALAYILCLIQRRSNDHEGVLVKSLERVHQLVGVYRLIGIGPVSMEKSNQVKRCGTGYNCLLFPSHLLSLQSYSIVPDVK